MRHIRGASWARQRWHAPLLAQWSAQGGHLGVGELSTVPDHELGKGYRALCEDCECGTG